MEKYDLLSTNFANNGYSATNVLEQFPQCKLLSESLNQLPDYIWSYIIKNSQLEQDFKISQCKLIDKNYKIARQDYEKGNFTFAFSRIVANDETMSIPVFKEIHDLFANQFKVLAEKMSGRKLEKMSVFYITRFDKGDFLTTHCDSGNSVGIVLNLSVDWNPVHGGLTILLPRNEEVAGQTYFPRARS